MKTLQQKLEELRAENEELRSNSERLRYDYDRALKEIQTKEEFNFALFQYSPIETVVVDRECRVLKSNTAKRRGKGRLPNLGDIMYVDYGSKHSINMHAELCECIRLTKSKTFPKLQYGNHYLSISIAPFPGGAIITSQNITNEVHAEKDRLNLISELRRALDEVDTLRGLLPICSSCKSIRDDGGYWSTLEEYFTKRSMVDFSHTVCPDCMKRLYPDLWEDINKARLAREALKKQHAKPV